METEEEEDNNEEFLFKSWSKCTENVTLTSYLQISKIYIVTQVLSTNPIFSFQIWREITSSRIHRPGTTENYSKTRALSQFQKHTIAFLSPQHRAERL